MKKSSGNDGDVRSEQAEWLQQLSDLNWLTFTAFGAPDALLHLVDLGYVFPAGVAEWARLATGTLDPTSLTARQAACTTSHGTAKVVIDYEVKQ